MDDQWTWSDVGARVAEARNARGLSQEQLAERTGIERFAVAKIETGRRQLNSLELAALGSALDRPLSWFVTPPEAAAASRRAEPAQRSDKASEHALDDCVRDLRTLVDSAVIRSTGPRSPVEPFTAEDTAAVVRTATDARRLVGADSREALHGLADTLEKAGLYTWSVHLGEQGVDGSYAALGDLGVAVVNSAVDAGRRRSTLAHEFGHHLLADAYSSDWGVDTGAHERAVDAFAAAFLLPPGATGEFRQLRRQNSLRTTVITLAVQYRVSWSTALRQLRSYEVVSEEEWRSLNRSSPTRADYMEAGVRVVEELGEGHVPTGVRAAAVRAYRTHKISATRALEIIRDDQFRSEDLGQPDVVPLEALRGELGEILP
ncbi:XRE family transcriptional regulator [Streptomyces cocklensis]|uniref:Zn-dependent peptidase ImmA, M78 family n=1 Tax=Actinacidiphila cocklensis TaxID=887465 RepID=A0A9W4DP40_9ACTN|nr:XRE family transcriptional regulator [Actinacidiphila cocklensis]MDD1061032.1 XRE family transcriptional regulator [Actinacidiphila cocklensis]CAG6391463.1 Zn-dependent peptidase ImmA, M78 family [Actinacidiphila cocklensis]